MKILFLGDVVGIAGCSKLTNNLLSEIKSKNIDFVIVNGENAASQGVGLTKEICKDFFNCGVNVITTGNHVWDQKEIMEYIEKEERLVLADVLEVGMSKYFYLIDGNRIRGVITKIENQDCSIQTAEGILIVPMSDILEETIDLIKLDDTRYKGPLLREDAESLLIRSKYGDVTIMKKEVLKMKRYHGGKLAPAIESRRTFDQGEDELISQFWDSNAFILEPNTFLLTPISLGYGFTDRFMISTRWSSNFNGDINLLPKIRLWQKKESTKESGFTLGLGIHQEYPLQTAISKFSHAFVNAAGESLNVASIPDDAFYELYQDDDNVLFEGYLVYSTKRKNPTGRGKVGWSVGVKTSNMINHLKGVTIDHNGQIYELSDDDKYKMPLRVYGLFHYDLQKNIKLPIINMPKEVFNFTKKQNKTSGTKL